MSDHGHDVTQQLLGTVEHAIADSEPDRGLPELARVAGVGLSDPSELWTFPGFPGPLVECRYILRLPKLPGPGPSRSCQKHSCPRTGTGAAAYSPPSPQPMISSFTGTTGGSQPYLPTLTTPRCSTFPPVPPAATQRHQRRPERPGHRLHRAPHSRRPCRVRLARAQTYVSRPALPQEK
jgi:hypothetical protein